MEALGKALVVCQALGWAWVLALAAWCLLVAVGGPCLLVLVIRLLGSMYDLDH